MAGPTMPNPDVNVTQPTPQVEKKDFINDLEDKDYDHNESDDKVDIYSGEADETAASMTNNGKDDDFDTISTQPKAQNDMQLTPSQTHKSTGTALNGRSSYTLSEAGSGYDEDTNECSEFCMDCCACFGLLDACCPSDTDGCISSTAIFLGNVCFSCCRCN